LSSASIRFYRRHLDAALPAGPVCRRTLRLSGANRSIPAWKSLKTRKLRGRAVDPEAISQTMEFEETMAPPVEYLGSPNSVCRKPYGAH
jgi:hypothetical protein